MLATALGWGGATPIAGQAPRAAADDQQLVAKESRQARKAREKRCRKAFYQGLRKHDRRQWPLVIGPMLEALGEECDSLAGSVFIPYGRWRYEYDPEVYLGTAIGFHEDRAPAAVDLAGAVERCVGGPGPAPQRSRDCVTLAVAVEKCRALRDSLSAEFLGSCPAESSFDLHAAAWWQCLAAKRSCIVVDSTRESRPTAGCLLLDDLDEDCFDIVSSFTQVFRPSRDPRIDRCLEMAGGLRRGGTGPRCAGLAPARRPHRPGG